MDSSKNHHIDKDITESAKQKYHNIEIPDKLDSIIEAAVDKGEKKDMLKYRIPLTAALGLCIFLFALSLYPKINFLSSGSSKSSLIEDEKGYEEIGIKLTPLPTVNSFENLEKLLGSTLQFADINNKDALSLNDSRSFFSKDEVSKSNPVDNNMTNSNIAEKSKSDYSNTNNHVMGVEEGDVVKTDGNFIYKLNGSTVQIIKAVPASDMKIVKSFTLNNELNLHELFIDNNTLTIIGTYYKKNNTEDRVPSDGHLEDSIYPINSTPITKILLYNISDKTNISQLRSFEISGAYYTARKIDSKIYIVSSQLIKSYKKDGGEQPNLPFYLDSLQKNEYVDITLDKIKYCPDAIAPKYLNISSIDVAKPNSSLEISTYMASAGNIYVSDRNLYISGYDRSKLNNQSATTLYKFSLNKGKADYTAKAEIPGTTLNQFSMDENNGYFRVATTVQPFSGAATKNNLYVLNDKLDIVGKIENIAPSERIYSTRFMGDRAYMVTFKNTDPLYAIDLKTPESPKILGALKLPGFSTYLHPYDENHIIGFGIDTEEVSESSSTGVITKRAMQKGLKLAMFDVTDLNNPKQMFSTSIGDNGTYSEALGNHKAFLFSKERQLLAFPLQVNEFDSKTPRNSKDPYGTLKFQGAYVYKVDLENGFTLKSKISHQTYKDKDSKRFTIDYNYMIQRLLYIDDVLYTISNNRITANSMSNYSEIGSLSTVVKQ